MLPRLLTFLFVAFSLPLQAQEESGSLSLGAYYYPWYGAADASKLKYAFPYESADRLGSMSAPNYDKLIGDFDYMKEHYFDHPAYLKIEGNLVRLRKHHPDVSLIGEDVFGERYHERHARLWNAVTAYDVGLEPKALLDCRFAFVSTNYRFLPEAEMDALIGNATKSLV